MTRYTLDEFVEQTRQRDRGEGLFELESSRMLEINLNGNIWTKMGSMVAYTGDVKFTREGILEHGMGKLLKRAVSGEGTRLTKAAGAGRIYLADEGKKVSIIHLQDETIFVNGNDILAFEESIQWDIKLMRKIVGVMAGGLFNVRLSGTGMIGDAIQTLRLGAWDYVLKPINDMELLKHAVSKALEKALLLKENERYHEHLE